MASFIAGVKKLSSPVFIVFVFSKVLVGIGIGVLLARYLMPYGWWFLIVGVVFSLICGILAIRKA